MRDLVLGQGKTAVAVFDVDQGFLLAIDAKLDAAFRTGEQTLLLALIADEIIALLTQIQLHLTGVMATKDALLLLELKQVFSLLDHFDAHFGVLLELQLDEKFHFGQLRSHALELVMTGKVHFHKELLANLATKLSHLALIVVGLEELKLFNRVAPLALYFPLGTLFLVRLKYFLDVLLPTKRTGHLSLRTVFDVLVQIHSGHLLVAVFMRTLGKPEETVGLMDQNLVILKFLVTAVLFIATAELKLPENIQNELGCRHDFVGLATTRTGLVHFTGFAKQYQTVHAGEGILKDVLAFPADDFLVMVSDQNFIQLISKHLSLGFSQLSKRDSNN